MYDDARPIRIPIMVVPPCYRMHAWLISTLGSASSPVSFASRLSGSLCRGSAAEDRDWWEGGWRERDTSTCHSGASSSISERCLLLKQLFIDANNATHTDDRVDIWCLSGESYPNKRTSSSSSFRVPQLSSLVPVARSFVPSCSRRAALEGLSWGGNLAWHSARMKFSQHHRPYCRFS